MDESCMYDIAMLVLYLDSTYFPFACGCVMGDDGMLLLWMYDVMPFM